MPTLLFLPSKIATGHTAWGRFRCEKLSRSGGEQNVPLRNMTVNIRL